MLGAYATKSYSTVIGRVVGELLGLVDVNPARRPQALGGQVVVQPPAHVLRIGLPAVAPPGVGTRRWCGVQLAVHVHQPPGRAAWSSRRALGQEAAVLLVAAPVLQVDLLVRDVDVAAQDEVAPQLQAAGAGRSGRENGTWPAWRSSPDEPLGKYATDDRVFACRRVETQFHVAPFGVKLAAVKADTTSLGSSGCTRPRPSNPSCRRSENAAHSRQGFELAGHIGRLGLDLLHTNTIRRRHAARFPVPCWWPSGCR
jgi:hypothetical protein